MLILLPPSEKKKAATTQVKFELSSLAFAAELTAARTQATSNYDYSQTSAADGGNANHQNHRCLGWIGAIAIRTY